MKGTDPQSRSPLSQSIVLKAVALLMALSCGFAFAQPGGREPIVAEVLVKGNRQIPADQVLSRVYTKPGNEYSTAVAQKDIERLSISGLFSRPPQLDVKDAPDGRVIVTFTVFEHANVVRDVQFKHANHISDKELEGIIRIRKGTPLDPVRNRLACFEIQDFLKKKGRLFANVTLEEGYKVGDTRVIFNITEGPIVRVRSIDFVGNKELASAARLKTQIGTGKAWFGSLGGVYEPSRVDEDVKKLEEYYKNNGYLMARVNRELRFDEKFGFVDLIFHLEEGVRFKIDSVTLDSNTKQIKKDDMQKIVQAKKNEFYSEGIITADVQNLEAFSGWRAIGTNVQKSLYMVPDQPGLVRVVYEVREKAAEPAKVGNVYIVGNDVTQDHVIRRTVGLYPGQYLRYPEVKLAENNLARLGIFEVNPEGGVRPTVTVIEDTDSIFKDIVVNVKETHTGSLLFGAGINSDAGLVGSIVLNEKNFDIFRVPTSMNDIWEGRAFRGGGQEFRIEAQPGTQLQRYTVSWRDPMIFDRPYSLGLSGYYYDRQYNEDLESRYGGRVTVGHQFTREWSVTAALRIENVRVSNVVAGAPVDYTSAQGSHLLIAPRISATYDTRNSFLRPSEGGVIEASYEQVFGDYNFPVLNLQASQFFTTYQRPDGSGKHVLAVRSQVSWAGSEAPVFERFFAGGFQSLRGFHFRGVGPTSNGFQVGGDFQLLNSLEYQIPIKANDNLYMVGFLDSGTVEKSFDIKDYRVSAGVGLRIIVPALGPVPIALDFGFPIVKAASDQKELFSFYVGLFR